MQQAESMIRAQGGFWQMMLISRETVLACGAGVSAALADFQAGGSVMGDEGGNFLSRADRITFKACYLAGTVAFILSPNIQ
jgi:hypothetical protein